MDQMPLSAVIFYSIPEEIILFSFGVTIVGEYINFKKIFIAAVLLAFTSMLLRACVPFGLHSIIGILVLFVSFWKLLNGLITCFLYNKKKYLIKGNRVSNDNEHAHNSTNLLVTLIILFQGIFLAIINQHLDYLAKYSLFIKLLYIIFFISSVLFLKRLYGGDGIKKTQYRDKT